MTGGSRATAQQACGEPLPALLHNAGYAPRASIIWHGLRDTAAPGATRLPTQGTWLHLRANVRGTDRSYRRDWNSASALLGLFKYRHGLSEPAAERYLVEMLECHCAKLDWPPCLVTARRNGYGLDRRSAAEIQVDDRLTTFVALAKSTGNVWLKHRPAQSSSIPLPRAYGPSMHPPSCSVEWDEYLWFPEGIPADLRAHAAQADTPENPMGRS